MCFNVRTMLGRLYTREFSGPRCEALHLANRPQVSLAAVVTEPHNTYVQVVFLFFFAHMSYQKHHRKHSQKGKISEIFFSARFLPFLLPLVLCWVVRRRVLLPQRTTATDQRPSRRSPSGRSGSGVAVVVCDTVWSSRCCGANRASFGLSSRGVCSGRVKRRSCGSAQRRGGWTAN